jgi:hypothetical protein
MKRRLLQYSSEIGRFSDDVVSQSWVYKIIGYYYYYHKIAAYLNLMRSLFLQVITVVLGLSFGRIDVSTPGGIVTMNGALFYMINEITWSNEFVVINVSYFAIRNLVQK